MQIPVSANDNERGGPRFPAFPATISPQTKRLMATIRLRLGLRSNTEVLEHLIKHAKGSGKSIEDIIGMTPKGGD